jgi:Tfp pilus tip-associated adhesin PilY1
MTVAIQQLTKAGLLILDSKYLFFNTWIPGEKTTVAPTSCSTQGNTSGSGYLMSVDVYTGGEADKALFDLSGNSVVDAGDKAKDSTNTSHSVGGRIYSTGLPGSSSFIQGIQYTPGTDAGTDLSGKSVIEVVGDSFRRRSWQELRKD